MKRIVTITYQGNCSRCGKKQIDEDPVGVDIDCWSCSVNANLERHDIIRDIENELQETNLSTFRLIRLRPGLERALEIIKKYDE